MDLIQISLLLLVTDILSEAAAVTMTKYPYLAKRPAAVSFEIPSTVVTFPTG